MKTFRANASESGFTLIELMIAMLIGVFLITGIIQIFLSAKQAYKLQENLSRLQENGRFAIDILTKDIRMAGFTGCSSKIIPNIILKDSSSIPSLGTGLNGVDNVASSNWNSLGCGTSPANQCVTGTDVISFQSAISCGAQLLDDVDKSADLKITTPNKCGVQQGDVAIIASCTSVDIFAISNNPGDGTLLGNGQQNIAHGGNLNINPPFLGSNYSKYNTEILVPRLFSYFIRTGTGGTPALWQVNNAKAANPNASGVFDPTNPENPVELVEGIENMQILYGVDTDTTQDFVPNYYVDASKVTDWTKVVSVRVSLLVATLDDGLTFATKDDGSNASQPYLYTYNHPTIDTTKPVTPTDRKIRRVFSSTIAVRNRLP